LSIKKGVKSGENLAQSQTRRRSGGTRTRDLSITSPVNYRAIHGVTDSSSSSTRSQRGL